MAGLLAFTPDQQALAVGVRFGAEGSLRLWAGPVLPDDADALSLLGWTADIHPAVRARLEGRIERLLDAGQLESANHLIGMLDALDARFEDIEDDNADVSHMAEDDMSDTETIEIGNRRF